jgi:mono/diheme cytochrome c family protein
VLQLDRDLRDVIVAGNDLLVTRFRSAKLLTVAPDGTVTNQVAPPSLPGSLTASLPSVRQPSVGGNDPQPAAVAWRTAATPNGGVLMLHERGAINPVQISSGGYGGASAQQCPTSIVQTSVTSFDANGATRSVTLAAAVLAVDMAVSNDGSQFAVVAPGNANLDTARQVFIHDTNATLAGSMATDPCSPGLARAWQATGQATAVAAFGNGFVVQSREPATLTLTDQPGIIRLPGESRRDTGHAIFHGNSGGNLACASCHPEGGDDGRVWSFANIGTRRTQSLRGGLRGTEPFHWDGDMRDFTTLVHDVFGERMSGGRLAGDQIDVLANWIESIPTLPAQVAADATAVDRGRAIFHDGTVGCAGCHAGPLMTNNATVNVGTGEAFQVPSLRGVASRTPLMHNGCAATLRDRLTNPLCGGGDQHGHTSQLQPAQITDLIAYLETL